MQSQYTVKSHIFNSWNDIPDVSHLLEIEDNYVNVFDRFYKEANQISFVAYIIDKGIIVAFGSATYFKTAEAVYYTDDDDEYCRLCNGNEKKQEENRLWIEGLVSTKKGCGTLIVQELERRLEEISKESFFEGRKIINIMSVNKSIAFYENLGYEETCTGPRFAGTDNTRVIKALPGYDLSNECIFELAYYDVANRVANGRSKGLEKFLIIPDDVMNKKGGLLEYVRNYFVFSKPVHDLFKDSIPLTEQDEIISELAEYLDLF